MSGDAWECSIPFSSPQRSLVSCTQVGQCTCAQQEAMADFGCRNTGFETYTCLCVALSFQVTCFLALGFVLLLFFLQMDSFENRQDVIYYTDNAISGKKKVGAQSVFSSFLWFSKPK